MTQEEAIVLFEKQLTAAQVVLDSGFGSNPGENDSLYRRRKEMAEIALSALRPVSREQVEQVWRSYWDGFSNSYADGYEVYDEWQCRKCGFEVETDEPETLPQFCPACGAPMTDEAVDILLKRLEVLRND